MDNEVSPLGVAWFVLGVLIAAFWGGAVRVMGSEDHIRQWVLRQIEREQPRVKVDFSSAELKLARGLFPTLAVEFKDLELRTQDPCDWSGNLRVSRFYVPLQIRAFFGGTLRAGDVEMEESDLELRPPRCSLGKSFNVSGAGVINEVKGLRPPEGESPVLSPKQKMMSSTWVRELSGTLAWLGGFSVAKLRIRTQSPEGQQAWAAEVQRLRLQGVRGNLKFNLTALVRVVEGRWASFFPEAMSLTAQGSADGATFTASLPMREGALSFEGRLDPTNEMFDLQFRAEQIPLSLLFSGLKELSLIAGTFEPRRTWLSMRGAIRGSAQDGSRAELSIESLDLEGEAGRINVRDVSARPLLEFWDAGPIRVFVTRLSIDKFLEAAGREGLRGVIEEFGVLEGELLVSGPQNLEFRGALRGLELKFSRGRERQTQKIAQIKGEWMIRDDRFSAALHDFEVAGGVANGELTFNLDSKFKDGIFQLHFPKVELSKDVSRLMMRGDLGSFALVGRGELKEGELVAWRGDIGIGEASVGEVGLHGVKLKTQFVPGKMQVSAQASQVDVDWSKVWSGQLAQVAAVVNQTEQRVALRNLRAKFDVVEEGGRWYQLQGLLPQMGWRLASEGSWSREAQIDGWLILESPRKINRKWRLSGEWGQPDLLRE